MVSFCDKLKILSEIGKIRFVTFKIHDMVTFLNTAMCKFIFSSRINLWNIHQIH